MVTIDLRRRRLLKLGVLAGGAVLAGGMLVPALRSRPEPRLEGAPLLQLGAADAELLEAVAEALLPLGSPWPSAREAEVVRRLDEELYFVAAPIQRDFGLALQAVDALPLLYGHFGRFRSLPLERRRRVLEQAEQTRFATLRAAVNGVRMAVNLVYFGHPATWPALGYDGAFAGLPPQPGPQRQYYRARVEGRA